MWVEKIQQKIVTRQRIQSFVQSISRKLILSLKEMGVLESTLKEMLFARYLMLQNLPLSV